MISDIQNKLPQKIKMGPRTRAWRGLQVKYGSIKASHSTLCEILPQNKKYLAYAINYDHLNLVCDFLSNFTEIFDSLEKAKEVSISLVVPSYYEMRNFCKIESTDPEIIQKLKLSFGDALKTKFKDCLSDLHYIATFLDPRYKKLKFLDPAKKEKAMMRIISKLNSITESMPKQVKTSNIEPKPKKVKIKRTSVLEVAKNLQVKKNPKLKALMKK